MTKETVLGLTKPSVYREKENEQDLSTICDKCYEGNVQRAIIENTLVVR